MNQTGLLLLPEPEMFESVRGYMLRAASENLLPTMFRRELETFKGTKSFISQMNQFNPEIAAHFTSRLLPLDVCKFSGISRAQLGNDFIPDRCLTISYRQICPDCFKEAPCSRIEWEIKSMQACPIHCIELASICPRCNKQLQWSGSGLLTCTCGQDLGLFPRKKVRTWQVNWATLVKRAVHTSLASLPHFKPSDVKVMPVSLSKLLLMADVLIRALLPEHLGSNKSHEYRWMLTPDILNDSSYIAYLWDAIFIFAAANPLEMAKTLTPGRTADAIVASYQNLLPSLSLPYALRDLQPRSKRVARPVKARFVAGSRKRGFAQGESDQVKPTGGGPPSWNRLAEDWY